MISNECFTNAGWLSAEITNADRASLALPAVEDFVASTGVDCAHDAIADLITDLLHLARGRNLDTEKLCADAQAMFRTETKCDAEGDMEDIQNRFRQTLPED